MMRSIFFISFLILGFCKLFSQNNNTGNLVIKNYTVDQGLPNNHVRGIVQDKNGFIWILTWDAVSRYDGYEFRNYYHDPKDSTSVPGMDNQQMIIDKYNTLWVSNPFGLWRYDPKKDSFVAFSLTNKIRYTEIALDPTGRLWIEDDNKLYLLIDSCIVEKINPVFSSGQKFENNYHNLVFDKNYNLIASRNDTIFCFKLTQDYDKKTYIVDKINQSQINPPRTPGNFHTKYFAFKTGGSIVISGNFGLFINDTSGNIYKKLDRTTLLSQLPEFTFGWNDSDSALYLIKEGKLFFTYKPEEYGIAQTWHIDKSKIIWLGLFKSNGEGNGLTKIITPSQMFNHHLTENETGERIGILSVMKNSNGEIWVSTLGNNYLYLLKNQGEPEKCIFLDQSKMSAFVHSRSFLEVDGKIFAGNSHGLMYRFDPQSKQVNYLYPGMLQSVLPDYIEAFKIIVKDLQGNIVIAGYSGIAILNHDLNKVLFAAKRKAIGDIFAVIQDFDKNYWFGTNGRLIFLDKNFKKEKEYVISNGIYNIESVIEGDSNHLWLALLGGGICKFNIKTGESEIFSNQHGLKNSTCYNVLKDKHGHIWVSTNQGISMFNPETERFRNFGEAEGLQIVEFNADAVWHGRDDEMMFGGMGGFVSFYPDSVENMSNDYYAPLLITELKVSGVSYFPNVYELKKVKLEKGMDNFQLTFACLDYMNADKLFYRYRLMENDTGWIVTDSRKRYANYINLMPGAYHFKVQVTDANGNWKVEKEASLELEIPPFYYQTLLLKAASGGTGIGLVIFSILLYIRNLNLKEKRKRELMLHEEEVKREQLKLEALRGQLNPHFIFNSLNSVNDFILDNDAMKANQYLTDFASLMRAFLENSKREYIPLIKEIELLDHYLKLEQIRYSDRFEFEIDYDEVQNIYSEISPSIVQPFVENAVWHGIGKMNNESKGKIRLVFTQKQPECIICFVEDNGIGISKATAMKSEQQKKRPSRGIGIIKERLEIINSTRGTNFSIKVEELNPGLNMPGTKVTIEIPIKSVQIDGARQYV